MNAHLGLSPIARSVVKTAEGDDEKSGLKDIFGGKPDVGFLSSIDNNLNQIWTWFLGGAVVVVFVAFVLGWIALGISRSDERKAADAYKSIKNAGIGIAGVLVAVPIVLTLVIALAS